MRTIILSIFMLMGIQITVDAQEQDDPYSPMLQDGKTWYTVHGAYVFSHIINGDTLINNKTWKKAYTDFLDEPFYYFAAIREEGEKVFCINDGEEEELLLYDFGMKVGDKFRCVSGRRIGYLYYITGYYESIERVVTVEDIDTIEVRGHQFRRFILKSNYALKASSGSETFDYPYFVWVEGIGSEGGLFVSGRKMTPDTQQYCMMGDTVIFEYDDFHVPGISDGINLVPAPMQEDAALYDLTGRRLTFPPSQGIYIRNGKKYVVK